jgi:hypothetical protein
MYPTPNSGKEDRPIRGEKERLLFELLDIICVPRTRRIYGHKDASLSGLHIASIVKTNCMGSVTANNLNVQTTK